MIPVAQHLPRAYARPPVNGPAEARYGHASAQPQAEQNARIIEAEWQPIAGPPVRTGTPYAYSSLLFNGAKAIPRESTSRAWATERYRSMEQSPQTRRGTLLDVSA